MPRVSIYVPDALKGEMDRIGEEVNWSGLAQFAFETEVSRRRARGDGSMENVIERLRLSKIENEEEECQNARTWGSEWAKYTASYADLKRIASAYDRGQFGDVTGDAFPSDLGRILRCEDNEDNPLWSEDDNALAEMSDDEAEAWLDGVLDVWKAVRSKL